MKSALGAGGIIALQAESVFLHQAIVGGVMASMARLFPVWDCAFTLVPTYTGGSIGVCLAPLGVELREPACLPAPAVQQHLRYYTPAIHRAAFVLPAFAERIVAEMRSGGASEVE